MRGSPAFCEAFAGMELYPGEEEMLATMDDVAVSAVA